MPKLDKEFGVAFDMGGCPNRCKHCYIEHFTNRRMPTDKVLEVFNMFKSYNKNIKVKFGSAFREPDYLDNYKELYELEKELNGQAERWELCSIFRAAKELDYVKWLKEIGHKKIQFTWFGMEENQDYYFGRKGTFKQWIDATNNLLDNGLIPRYQYFLTKRTVKDLGDFVQLIKDLKLEERCLENGHEFELFLHTPGPYGNAYDLEKERIELSDIQAIPEYLLNKTYKYRNCNSLTELFGKTEREMIVSLKEKHVPLNDQTNLYFLIDNDFNVYPNLSELKPWSCLGNISEGINVIIDRYINDSTMLAKLNHHTSISELCNEFGEDTEKLYLEEDLVYKWFRDFCEKYYK